MIRTRAITLTVPTAKEIGEMRACTTIIRQSQALDPEKHREFLSFMDSIDEGRRIELSRLSLTVNGEPISYRDTMSYVGDFRSKDLDDPILILAEQACEGASWFDGLVDNTDELAAEDFLLVVVNRTYGQRCVGTLVVPSGDDAIKERPIQPSDVRSVLKGICF